MKKTIGNLKVGLVLGVLSLVGAAGFAVKTAVADSQVDATIFLDNTRYSFSGRLAAGSVSGSSLALIQTWQDATNAVYSTSSAQLQSGDMLRIGDNFYYVATGSAVMPDGQVALDRPLDAADVASGTAVLGKAESSIRVSFTLRNDPLVNGALQVLVPAYSQDMTASDGNPDPGYFDYNATPTVTCPTGGGVTWNSPTATPSAGMALIGGGAFHAFSCSFNGSLSSLSADDYMTIKGMLNPAPRIGHTFGEVDLTTFKVQELDASGFAINTENINTGVVEAVKAIVSIAPQLTFEINGVAENETMCDGLVTTDVATTGVAVPFGDISAMMFRNAAQQLSISTNAANGYAITVAETDQLTLEENPDICLGTNTGMNNEECINDFTGSNMPSQGAEPALDVPVVWEDSSINGFGYTVGTPVTTAGAYVDANGVSHAATAPYSSCTIDAATNTCSDAIVSHASGFTTSMGYRKFADQSAVDPDTTAVDGIEYPRAIMRNTSSTNEDTMDFCYRITPSAATTDGDYKTTVMFTATATF